MTNTKLFLLGVFSLALSQHTIAQGIHYTPFYTTPTALNPAFSGMFDGKVRAGIIYRNQWESDNTPYNTVAISADMPVATMKNGSYIAAGIQATKDQAGDGNLANFVAAGSVSYHKLLNRGRMQIHPIDIGIGMQAAYSQTSIDLNRLYFDPGSHSDPTLNPFGITAHAYPVALGLSFSQRTSGHFSYTVGLSAQNVFESGEETKQQRGALGLDRYYSFVYGANWQPGKRLTISPALVLISHNTASDAIIGSEFGYRLSSDNTPVRQSTSVFLAGWYRSSNIVTAGAGIEHRNIKLGISYDYLTSTVYRYGYRGTEIFIKYIVPSVGLKRTQRFVPSSRF